MATLPHSGEKRIYPDSPEFDIGGSEAALYKTIVEISPDAIVLSDTEGRILMANRQADALFGFEHFQEFPDRLIADFVAESHKETVRATLGQQVAGLEVHNAEYRMLRLDGEPFWGEVSAKRIPVSASGPGIILYMIRDISTKKHAEDDLRNLLVTDELTGLFNRRGFMIAADQELKHAKRIGKSVVMLFMDVDDLKDVNDKFGHTEGDALLRELASVLRSTFRESDIVARLGGDEFVVLALDVPEGSAASLVNRLHATLESRDASSAKPYRLAVSMGTTLYNPAEPCSLSELITDADSLMYLDKKSKKH